MLGCSVFSVHTQSLGGSAHQALCIVVRFLADCRPTARSMIGHWHDNVVRLSVTLCIVAKRYILQQKRLNKLIGSAL